MEENKFTTFLAEKFAPAASKFGNNKYVRAISDSMVATISLSIIGGLSLLLASPPVDPETLQGTNFFFRFMLNWHAWAVEYGEIIITPFLMTMGIMSIFIAMGVAYSLSKHYSKDYDVDPFSSAVISGVIFLMVAGTVTEGAIPIRYLDAKGLFSAMIVGVVTVEVTRLLVKHDLRIKMPEGVPPAVSASFTALIPMLVNVIIFYGLNLFLVSKFDVTFPQLVFDTLTPVMQGTDNVWFIAITMFLSSLLWSVGIHGGAVVSSVTTVVYTSHLMANAAAKQAGQPMPFILAGQVSVFMVVVGGSGATLGLNLLMLRSKSKQLKTVGKIGIVPGLFGINEPILFGTPIILNPLMAIPFILTPVINGFVAYYIIKFGLMGRAFITVPWTMPPFIGMPLATMDWRAFFWVLFIIALDIAIYYPFFKTYEKQLVEREMSEGEAVIE